MNEAITRNLWKSLTLDPFLIHLVSSLTSKPQLVSKTFLVLFRLLVSLFPPENLFPFFVNLPGKFHCSTKKKRKMKPICFLLCFCFLPVKVSSFWHKPSLVLTTQILCFEIYLLGLSLFLDSVIVFPRNLMRSRLYSPEILSNPCFWISSCTSWNLFTLSEGKTQFNTYLTKHKP